MIYVHLQNKINKNILTYQKSCKKNHHSYEKPNSYGHDFFFFIVSIHKQICPHNHEVDEKQIKQSFVHVCYNTNCVRLLACSSNMRYAGRYCYSYSTANYSSYYMERKKRPREGITYLNINYIYRMCIAFHICNQDGAKWER